MKEGPMLTTNFAGLHVGDVITFSRYIPWWRKLWWHLRYMRHNNPLYEKPREFVVSWTNNANSYGIAPDEIRDS